MSERLSPKAYSSGWDARWLVGSKIIEAARNGQTLTAEECEESKNPYKEFTQQSFAWLAGYRSASEVILGLKWPNIANETKKLG
jgi:hypothetical protein